MKKIFVAFLVILCLVLCLSACSDAESRLKDETKDVLREVMRDNREGVYSYMNKDVITPEELESSFPSMSAMLEDVGFYSLRKVSYEVTESDGVISTSGIYYLYAYNGDVFEIKVRQIEGREGFVGFVIREVMGENTEDASTSLDKLISLALVLISVALAVWAIVDCVKKFLRVNKKLGAVLILLIILGFSLRFIFGEGGLYIMPLPTFTVIFSGAGVYSVADLARLTVFVPVGVAIYFALRKRLIRKYISENTEEDKNDC